MSEKSGKYMLPLHYCMLCAKWEMHPNNILANKKKNSKQIQWNTFELSPTVSTIDGMTHALIQFEWIDAYPKK